MINRKTNNKGFTLVELLVVIAIIGILAVVAVPSLMKNMEKAKAAKIVADFSAIKSAVMAEYADGSTIGSSTDVKTLVEDVSGEASYILDVVGTPITEVKLIIKPINPKVIDKVIGDIGGTPTDTDNDKITDTITISVVKPSI